MSTKPRTNLGGKGLGKRAKVCRSIYDVDSINESSNCAIRSENISLSLAQSVDDAVEKPAKKKKKLEVAVVEVEERLKRLKHVRYPFTNLEHLAGQEHTTHVDTSLQPP